MEKQRLIHSLEKRNGDLNKDIGRTRDRIGRLANDPDERERVARERLNVVEKRDKVYVTGDPTPKKPAGR
jgi:cell division protein FtsB